MSIATRWMRNHLEARFGGGDHARLLHRQRQVQQPPARIRSHALESHALPARGFGVGFEGHDRNLTALAQGVAEPAHQRELDVPALPFGLDVHGLDVQQIVAGALTKLVTEAVAGEENRMDAFELGAVGVERVVERLARVDDLADVDPCGARVRSAAPCRRALT